MSRDETTAPGGSVPAQRARLTDRLELLDVLRGAALVAMAIYHFTWDLEFFQYLDRGTTGMGGWKLFARCIASSFLFLAGASLVLAHGRGIRWLSFRRRFAQVAAGAAIITLTTYVATPNGFVFFGILHQIALASLLGLLFLRLPWFVTAVVGAVVIAMPQFVETPLTDPKVLAWIGLSERPPVSNDFVPVFPWFGAVLLGIASASLAGSLGWWDRARALNPRLSALSPLAWLGRRSLLFYLVHQPVLIGLVWAFAQLAPPDPTAILQSECQRGCLSEGRDAAFCKAYCGCVQVKLESAELLRALLDGLTTIEENARIEEMALECSAAQP